MTKKDACYLILLGGTGAKCGEILVHMCANGYMECDSLNILYIDSDIKNGNKKQFEEVVKIYQECRKLYMIQASPVACFFKPKINFFEKSPVEGYSRFRDLTSPRGSDITGINSAEVLMKALYSETEQNMEISEGFFAHPNVGAAFFASNMESIMGDFVQLIKIDSKQMKNVKIFMIGSIFGGTGASSLPTISKYLKKEMVGKSDNNNINECVKIGGCMVLPYFLFSRENVKEAIHAGESIEVEADKFVTKTRSALKYYKYVDEKQDRSIFDCLYLMGHDQYDVRGNYQTAGAEQKNMPHITEFYSATAAVDFFDGSIQQSGRFFAVIPTERISWSGIYKKQRGYYAFFVMMRFAMVMKTLILEELFDYTRENKLKPKASDIPWYYDFLDGREPSADKVDEKLYERFAAVSDYCDAYIRWFAELNIANIDKRYDVGMIDYESDGGISDIVEYLDLFDQELLITQHFNNCITKGTVAEKDSEVYNNIYVRNIKYIRNHFQELGHSDCTDRETEKVEMQKIWSRICDLGYNSTILVDDIVENLTKSADKSLEAGVRNLINAVFIACLI